MADRRGGEHIGVFRRFQQRFGSRRTRRAALGDGSGSAPFEPGRDPGSLGAAVEGLVRERGWDGELARSELFVGWAEAVGPAVADHTSPSSLEDGILVVRCDSTAWATQLGLMRPQLLTALAKRFPEAGVLGLRILGPDVPSFKRGLRSVPGRGPRDTYG